MYKIKRTLTVLAFSFLALTVCSQNLNTYSPYSRFGVGIISNQGFTQNLGMGGISQVIRNPYAINYLNPASYSAQDSMSFIFDFGVQGSSTTFAGYDQYLKKYTANSSTGGIHHISIAFPVSKKWGVAAGIAPFSNVGYSMFRYETDPVLLSTFGRIKYEHIGRGGINQLFVGTGYSPVKNLSVGFNLLYYFGSLDYNNNILFPASTDDYTNAFIKSSLVVSDISYNIGFQYAIILNKETKSSLIIGATVENKQSINLKHKWIVDLQGNNSNFIDSVVPYNDLKKSFTLPTSISTGFAYNHKNKLLASVEYFTQDWSKTEAFNTNDPLSKMETFRTGIEYTPNVKDLKSYFKKVNYRFGGYYKNSNILVGSTQISDYGITFGVGLPIRSNTRFNVSFELGKRGTNENYLIKETYGLINLSITFHDSPWFFKRKYN